ncbi:serine hydrolase [Poriferisphaera sp. WC338]|uniref:serine hydrolase n=1 Tax=Poriferisphaera sp. WC338 TaxID=3425129 RepID=UPI003D813C7B
MKLPADYVVDYKLNDFLNEMVNDLDLHHSFDVGEDGLEEISLAVVDFTGWEKKQAKKQTVRFGGVYHDNFIYPCSIYKMYVAGALLSLIEKGEYELDQVVEVKSPNDVDRSKEIPSDPRPLLHAGDKVTIGYLLDLMITRSDNCAANCCIDMAQRPRINEMLLRYGYAGSEVTRKYLSRSKEDEGYADVPSTMTCGLHTSDFLYRAATGQMESPWVSQQLMRLLGGQLDKSKLAKGLPRDAMMYHKTGWFSYWSGDCAVIDDGAVRYALSLILPIAAAKAELIYKEIAAAVHGYMTNYSR